MYWEVGLKIDSEAGQVTVHPAALEQSKWDNAMEHALEMAQALYPSKRIEFPIHQGIRNSRRRTLLMLALVIVFSFAMFSQDNAEFIQDMNEKLEWGLHVHICRQTKC